MISAIFVFQFDLSLEHSCQRTGSPGSRNRIGERGLTCQRTRIGQGYTSLVCQIGSGIAIHFDLDRLRRIKDINKPKYDA
jgi:hypothetical protein